MLTKITVVKAKQRYWPVVLLLLRPSVCSWNGYKIVLSPSVFKLFYSTLLSETKGRTFLNFTVTLLSKNK